MIDIKNRTTAIREVVNLLKTSGVSVEAAGGTRAAFLFREAMPKK